MNTFSRAIEFSRGLGGLSGGSGLNTFLGFFSLNPRELSVYLRKSVNYNCQHPCQLHCQISRNPMSPHSHSWCDHVFSPMHSSRHSKTQSDDDMFTPVPWSSRGLARRSSSGSRLAWMILLDCELGKVNAAAKHSHNQYIQTNFQSLLRREKRDDTLREEKLGLSDTKKRLERYSTSYWRTS